MENKPLYLLYSGQSVDGLGTPDYAGRTEDISVAFKHWTFCKENPYSTGKVVRITDTKETLLITKADFGVM